MPIAQLIVNGLVHGLSVAVLALAFSVVYVPTRIFHIALAGLYVIAPYIAWSAQRAGWPWPVAVGTAVVLTAVFGIMCEIGNHRFLERRGAGPGAHFVSSLGVAIILVQAVTLLWGSEVKTLAPGVRPSIELGTIRLGHFQVVTIVVATGLIGAFFLSLWKTKLGLLLRAMAGNVRELSLRGHDVPTLRIGAFATSGAFCAAASLLVAFDTSFDPHAGFPLVLSAIVAVMIGGRTSFTGPVIGGLLVGAVRAQTAWFLSARWNEAATFALLALGLLLLPEGILRGVRRLEAGEP